MKLNDEFSITKDLGTHSDKLDSFGKSIFKLKDIISRHKDNQIKMDSRTRNFAYFFAK